MSILIKNVLSNNRRKDIYIEENSFTEISDNINVEAEYKINGNKKAILPSFFNSHTHAAMSLLKGYADDMVLQEWLDNKIWPIEKKLTAKDVYIGTKLAILEMIKSGTTFFNDMYWFHEDAARAAKEIGVRACLAQAFVDFGVGLKPLPKDSELVKFAYGPHAVYTVNKENLLKLKDLADKENRFFHIHLSETKKEVDDSIKNFGKRPVDYLAGLGILDKNVIAAHSVWLNDNEMNLLAKNKTPVVYNPVSNAKLSAGILNFSKLKNAGVNILLGTDGSASNNNLDMFEEMKFAALLQKVNNSPISCPAREIYHSATESAANIFNIKSGKIEKGKLADFILVDLKNINLFPNHNLISNLVYSAKGDCVTHTVCNGKILMKDRIIENEEKILEEAQEIINKIF